MHSGDDKIKATKIEDKKKIKEARTGTRMTAK